MMLLEWLGIVILAGAIIFWSVKTEGKKAIMSGSDSGGTGGERLISRNWRWAEIWLNTLKLRRCTMRHCHDSKITVPVPQGAKNIVLAGNPNSGKSVFFNFLTGLYVDVSNYPGTTLEISSGRFGDDLIIDTPGVYGLSSFNDEERIARDIILKADIVINIVNAVNLERDLFLTQQIIDTGVPVLVVLNMMDEVERKGLSIDTIKLSKLLGVPVFPAVAVQKKGLDTVRNNIYRATPGNGIPGLEEYLARLPDFPGSRGEALLYLEEDPVLSERFGLPAAGFQEEIYQRRREWVNGVVQQVLAAGVSQKTLADSFSRLMLHPWAGWLILAGVLWGLYQFIGSSWRGPW